jgi:23S rRNA (guanosine2251-2'-O)-methyltransferase
MTRRGNDERRPVAVVGRRAALEAVRSGHATEVLVAETARSTAGLREVVEAAGSAGVPVRSVAEDRIDSLSGGERHQGVVARVTLPRPLDESGLARRTWPEDAVVVVVDGVTDPHNLGAIARSAEAAGAGALVTRRHRGAALGPAAVRASAGALVHLPVAEVPNITRAIGRLKDAGFWIVGLDEHAAATIDEDEPPPGRIALVLGSEGTGLSRLVRESCDDVRSIPLRGAVGSLNVSVAAGVGLFAYVIRGKGKRRT